MILDVGCGHNRQHLKKGDLGIDLQKGLCDIQASALYLPFRHGTFETVLMSHVLEHLMNLEVALNEVKRVLKSGGILEVEVPNPSSFFIFRDYCISRKAKLGNTGQSPDHICAFGEGDIQNLLRFMGFTPLRIRYKTSYRFERIFHQKTLIKRLFYKGLFRLFPAFQNAFMVTSIKP